MIHLARFIYSLILFVFYSIIHDVLIKWIYCKWKKKHNNGYKCYFWSCKYWHDCPFNGTKRRFLFLRNKGSSS